MPRIRSIKPESCVSEPVNSVSVLAALAFAYLPCFCDDEGRMKYSPTQIKGNLFPIRWDVGLDDCERIIAELVGVGLVVVYEAEGTRYLQVTNFAEHQHPNKPRPSTIPAPKPEDYRNAPGMFRECSRNRTDQAGNRDMPKNASVLPAETQDSRSVPVVFQEYSGSATGGIVRESNGKVGSTSANADALSEVLSGKPDDPPPPAADAQADKPPGFAEMRRQVIAHLNATTGAHFKPNSKSTAHHLDARFRDGFTVDDCKRVIDAKAAEWLNSPKMRQYLRPETLFAGHFEGYLSEAGRRTPEDEELDQYSFRRRGA